ncbi:MAG TPA: NADH-quinone oxidoreductase subunit J [Bryobacteraceae bacterium]|nr:NADH-quinone oxidoreductase subunit J [Bryobacteraceae bacterium]
MNTILFLILAVVAVGCGINVILQTHPISSALSLVGVMGALAVLYLQLGGEFIAAAQLIVYAGAVMVLFVFVIMLLNAGKEQKSRARIWVRWAGPPLLLLFVGAVAYVLEAALPPSPPVRFGGFDGGTVKAIGERLFTEYLLPFEVTSLLILIAIAGAIVLARKEID